ncbi:NADH-quinone oxidoreductase subunit C [Streptomyces iranensis]|uniref:NADH:ubiquinone oxidoreductase subunit C n=1 Tax=Streptomyces iranensis TaxID=576784 RepID=A0ABS4N676_9ACTN|nr:NADH-quinone oxidoreductase subunit C [Streptomyces iranensis]MBP2066902.1 NADH:ubiquinone oxidoreductase subunit C [Streptomyces iranensis]
MTERNEANEPSGTANEPSETAGPRAAVRPSGTGPTGAVAPSGAEPTEAGPTEAEPTGAAQAAGAAKSTGAVEATGAAEAAEVPETEASGTEPAAEAAPPVGWLPRSAAELFGEGATAAEAYGLLTVDVPADSWIAALETARDTLGCTYFDWLSAVDEPGTGFRVAARVVALGAPGATPGATPGAGPGAGPAVRGLLLRTTVPHEVPALPTATGVYAGAAWHERETHEMFGIGFPGHPGLAPLLLPDGFEGHPLRKDFVLAARVVKAWPGAKEPGESEHGGPKRRQMLPPGVPDPNEWGPLKGQLPPAPARPARGARAAGAAAGERPARRTRSATAGSASQRPAGAEAAAESQPPAAERPARRSRSAGEGSASQRSAGAEAAAEASATDAAADEPLASAEPTAPEAPARPRRPAPQSRSSDAPWHHARPARDEDAESKREPQAQAHEPEPEPEPEAETEAAGDGRGAKPAPAPAPAPEPGAPGTPDATPDNDTDDQPGGTA